MYKVPKYNKTKINVNNATDGETLETKIQRRMANKEPIKGEAPLLYTEKKDGVMAGTNIKTDRFEVALDGVGTIQKSQTAKRDNIAKLEIVKDDKNKENQEGKPEVNTESKKEGKA